MKDFRFMKDFRNVDVDICYGGSVDGVQLIRGSATSCNVIGFEAGTTGYCGGDSGHGGRTFFTIFDETSSDIRATTSRDGRELRVELGGDSELDTIIKALKSIAMILEAGASKGTKVTDVVRIRDRSSEVKAMEHIVACLKTLVPAKD